MGRLRQFYDGAGMPLRLDLGLDVPATAWRSQRARLRAWLDSVPDSEWGGPTRCALWNTNGLVRHLVSGSQFLGYTLHKSNGGVRTTLLGGFDTHETVQADAARFGDMTPGVARELLASKDGLVEAELRTAEDNGWAAMAEAPPGHLPAHLAVNHFFMDSWVHEYDLMLPRGELPLVDRLEAVAAVGYLIGLASLQTGSTTPLDLRLTNPEIRIGADSVDDTVHVTIGSAPDGGAVIEGRVVDLVDRATGRAAGLLRGDQRGLAVLDGFGELLAR